MGKKGLSRKKTAMMAAEMSIWSDDQMRGIPSIRWHLVEAAAKTALGKPKDFTKLLGGMSQANIDAAHRAFTNAVFSASASIIGLAR